MRLANSSARPPPPQPPPLPLFLWLFLIATLFGTVCANTEIVNIAATLANDVSFSQTSNWPILSDDSPEYLWYVQPAPSNMSSSKICETRDDAACPHEIWAVLDLDSPGWSSFRKFTLRISWPAYYPTDFSIQIFSPQEALDAFTQTGVGHDPAQLPQTAVGKTRRQYVRIRLVDTGVRVPSLMNTTVEATPFMIILEPLYFTMLPASVVPTLLFLIPVVLTASILVFPWVYRYLSGIIGEIHSEGRGNDVCKEE